MIRYVAVRRWELLGFPLLACPFQGEPQTRRPALATATGYRWPAPTASLVSAEGNSAEPPRRRIRADIQRSKTEELNDMSILRTPDGTRSSAAAASRFAAAHDVVRL